MLKGLGGKVHRLNGYPLLERPVKKYISSVIGVNDYASIMNASASGS